MHVCTVAGCSYRNNNYYSCWFVAGSNNNNNCCRLQLQLATTITTTTTVYTTTTTVADCSSLYALLERTNCTTYGEANTRRDGLGAMARYTFGG